MDTHTANNTNNPINWKESEEDRAAAKNELIRETLQTLSIEYLDEDATEFLNVSYLEELESFDSHSIYDELNDNGFFNVEIIYYSNAMDYLRENDCSLSESIELATEYGFTFEHLNSEALASLHASRHREDDFWQFVAPELDKINN